MQVCPVHVSRNSRGFPPIETNSPVGRVGCDDIRGTVMVREASHHDPLPVPGGPARQRGSCRTYWTSMLLDTEEKTSMELFPTIRAVATTTTRMTASITAYSAMSCPFSSVKRRVSARLAAENKSETPMNDLRGVTRLLRVWNDESNRGESSSADFFPSSILFLEGPLEPSSFVSTPGF